MVLAGYFIYTLEKYNFPPIFEIFTKIYIYILIFGLFESLTLPSESVLHALIISAPPVANSSKQLGLLRS